MATQNEQAARECSCVYTKKLPLPRWMRNGLPSKLTEEDRDYEISSIVGHHDFAADGDTVQYFSVDSATVIF